MKKSSKILIIIAVIAAVLVIAGICVIVILNRAKTPINAGDFQTEMTSEEYTVSDVTDQYSEYGYLKNVYVARDKSDGYQLEFYSFSNESEAITYYNNMVKIFESNTGPISVNTHVNGKNYSKYALTSNRKYMIVSRVADTVVHAQVDEIYKNDVKSTLSKLGY